MSRQELSAPFNKELYLQERPIKLSLFLGNVYGKKKGGGGARHLFFYINKKRNYKYCLGSLVSNE